MSIISSEIYKVVGYGNAGQLKVFERFVDHIGVITENIYIADSSEDINANLIVHTEQVNQDSINNEISNSVALYESGSDPLHIDMGGWFTQVIPNYQTWDELAAAVTINFLERVNQLELVYIETIIIRISTTDKKRIWGMTNPQVSDVNTAIQDAINTKVVIDTYSPFFIDGVLQ